MLCSQMFLNHQIWRFLKAFCIFLCPIAFSSPTRKKCSILMKYYHLLLSLIRACPVPVLSYLWEDQIYFLVFFLQTDSTTWLWPLPNITHMAVHYIFVSPQASPKFHIAMSNRNGFTNLLLNAMRVGRGNFSSDHCLDSNILL